MAKSRFTNRIFLSGTAAAFVMSTASAALAAANPFEDVPAGHWAYDALAGLAANGYVSGYGDGTFRGYREITRYEMAQMIARAIAKQPTGADKARVDKLAAEFADELDALGVRVSALEKKADNLKWQGVLRYRYITRREEHRSDQPLNNANQLLLRLNFQAEISEHWTAMGRIDYLRNSAMSDAANFNNVNVDRVWVQGCYDKLAVRLGKFPVMTEADYGMTMDYRIAGGEACFGKDIRIALRGGRLNLADAGGFLHGANNRVPDVENRGPVTYYGMELFEDRAKKFTWGIGWQHINGGENKLQNIGENLDLVNAGLGWKFDGNVSVFGAYAYAFGVHGANDNPIGLYDKRKYRQSAAIRVNYKNVDRASPGSWGAYLSYRHLGDSSIIHSTCRENGPTHGGEQGFEFGVGYTFARNIVGRVLHFRGREIASGNKANGTWVELGFFF